MPFTAPPISRFQQLLPHAPLDCQRLRRFVTRHMLERSDSPEERFERGTVRRAGIQGLERMLQFMREPRNQALVRACWPQPDPLANRAVRGDTNAIDERAAQRLWQSGAPAEKDEAMAGVQLQDELSERR